MTSIQKAKELNPANPNIIRTEIIAALRCDDQNGAYSYLKIYMAKLSEQIANIKNEDSRHLAFLQSEQEWARKMLIKVQGLSGVMRLK